MEAGSVFETLAVSPRSYDITLQKWNFKSPYTTRRL